MSGPQLERLPALLLEAEQAAKVEISGEAVAAVLVPLYESDGELWAVLTRRRDDLPRHAGQISFPGGRTDPADRDLVATALREAHEEIGLHPSAVSVLGALDPVSIPVSGFAVYPFVGAIERPAAWSPAADEVAAILELALRPLAASHGQARIATALGQRDTPTFDAPDSTIWGATAFVLLDLLRRIGLL